MMKWLSDIYSVTFGVGFILKLVSLSNALAETVPKLTVSRGKRRLSLFLSTDSEDKILRSPLSV